jgi:hypothetical protein
VSSSPPNRTSIERARRFERQVLLYGQNGQRSVDASAARVAGPTAAHAVAESYARAAGFARIEPGAIDVEYFAPVSMTIHAGPRDVLAGARAALAEIRSAIDRLEGA